MVGGYAYLPTRLTELIFAGAIESIGMGRPSIVGGRNEVEQFITYASTRKPLIARMITDNGIEVVAAINYSFDDFVKLITFMPNNNDIISIMATTQGDSISVIAKVV